MEIIDAEFERRPRGEVAEEVIECEARVRSDLLKGEEVARAFGIPRHIIGGMAWSHDPKEFIFRKKFKYE